MATGNSVIENKLVQLKLIVGRTKKILESGNQEAVERQQRALRTIVADIDKCKVEEEARMIDEKKELTEISEWNSNIEEKLSEADKDIYDLREWCESKKRECEENQRKQELDFEHELFQTRLKFQNELQAAKLKQESASVEKKESQAKLPKLIITKFNGAYQDWPRFWEQFRETVDKTSIDAVVKFAYLQELLEPKIRKSVEALPFTSEGYNRAKSILQERYGKQSEIIKAYTKHIFDLPKIPDGNVKRIHEFSDKLSYAVQSLETLGKLSQVNGYVSMTLDKLPGIRGDLVRTDDAWESWDFVKLSDAVRLWTRRNPVEKLPSGKLLNIRSQDFTPKGCVYCTEKSHKSAECPKVSSVSERRLILTKQHLCYNCTGSSHRANDCPSQSKCQKCGRRHHTSICDSDSKSGVKGKKLLISCEVNPEGIFPVVRMKVDGVECRALIDSGAGSSYASAKLINLLEKKPVEVARKRVDMLMNSQEALLETYEAVVEAVTGDFRMCVNLTKVKREELLFVDNPCYEEVIKKYPHLEGVEIVEDDVKAQLPIHVVLSSGDFSRIKTDAKPRVGRDGEPIAELTKLGWFIMSPGSEFDKAKMFLTQTTHSDYEQLCKLDVLGLEDKPENDQGQVYSEFKEQLVRNGQGWYETALPWRGNHPNLPTNEKGSISRLNSLVRKLERTELYNAYDQIIRDQLEEGIVESAPTKAENQEFYLPHRAVVRDKAETTKLRVVYDGSARETLSAPSLNDCINPGPPLQNRLWDVLIRQRGYPVAVSGDIQKAFLQVRIKAAERDALRFHWKHPGDNQIHIYRFTRALFGLTCSPFLLGGVIDQHLELWRDRKPAIVEELRKNLYVDDLLSGGNTVAEAGVKKLAMTEVLADGAFKLHKWNSNERELEDGEKTSSECEQTFAKTQLGVEPNESKLLGLKWEKDEDTLSVVFPSDPPATTKRGMLSKLARVYDPLGLASPITVSGKMVYRDVCDSKASWDAELSGQSAQEWSIWEKGIPELVTVPRSLAKFQEDIHSVTLHAFGDASIKGVSAAVYSVVNQPSGTTQTLVAAKSRLAKRNLTIPRLELTGAHMAVNLLTNVRQALDRFLVVDQHCWLDSTVALYWLQGNGRYKQFVQNRVNKIHQHPNISWHYVPTKDNPADLGSRGTIQLTDQWISGPQWLSNQEEWPKSPVLKPTKESKTEEQLERVLSTCALQVPNDDDQSPFDELQTVHANNVWKTLRVCAWINRFLTNCRKAIDERKTGPLTTQEIQHQELWWIKKTQQEALSTNTEQFQRDRVQFNIQKNGEGVLECRGRIEGQYPIFLPDTASYTKALVFQAHLDTLHGGVTLTMAKLREQYWIPRLRRLVKLVRSSCYGCVRFRATSYSSPPPGQLPTSRTQGETPYAVVGIDFAGPIKYRIKANTDGKAYLILYACSLTRGVYLELLHSLETDEFMRSLKRFVARRGRPRIIYSDNGSTFKAAAKLINLINKDEKINNYLAKNSIEWKFNLSRAPWWGGQFERLVGVFKSAFHKTVGNGTLNFDELSAIVLDVETSINGRPLDYVEDDIQLPLLTPNSFMFLQPTQPLELEPHHLQETTLRKRARYLSKVKDSIWARWSKEYVRSLREKHRLLQQDKKTESPEVGDIVIIRGDEKNRNLWKLGKVVRLILGRDGEIRGAKVQTGNGILERTPQHLYPLELKCDFNDSKQPLNPDVVEFRPRRGAAIAAEEQIRAINMYNDD